MAYDPRISIVGHGPPVVLVPGLDGTGLLFYRQVEHLSRRHRVITFRLRDDAEAMETLIADLRAIAEPHAPVTIVGESFGGALSMSFALAHTPLVSRAVILNSFAYFEPQRRLAFGYHLLRAMPWGMMPFVRKLTAARLHSKHTHTLEIRRFHELMRQTTRDGYLSRLSILRRYDVRSQLANLHTPTMFLASDCDHLVPSVEQARIMASLVAGAELRVLKGHGHICLLAPDIDLSQILDEWAASVISGQ